MRILKQILKWLFGVGFALAGVLHFILPEYYLKIMPPVLPAPLFLVYLSGVFEIVLGILLLIPKYTRRAAYGLMALLIAVFPANIYMAANPQLFSQFSSTALYARLPLQIVLMGLIFWCAKPDEIYEKEL